MKDLFTNKYFILLLVVTVLLLAVMTVYTADRESVTLVEDLIGATLAPVQKLFSNMSLNSISFFAYFSDLAELRKENDELKARISELEFETRELDAYRFENKRFRTMLNFKESFDYVTEPAEVIAKDSGTWYNTFTLDKGAANGIAVNMPVVTDMGLVGRIYDVGTNWSKVVSILELDNAVGCLVTRNSDIAVIEGDQYLKEAGLMKITYLEKGANILVGDYLETSGLGGIYPKGLLIGQISEITLNKSNLNQIALVTPAVSFERITEVFIITNSTTENTPPPNEFR